jgi:hypothetical protein
MVELIRATELRQGELSWSKVVLHEDWSG